MRILSFFLLPFCLICVGGTEETTPSLLSLQTYVTAGQVESLFSPEETRQATVRTLREQGIRKVYLETIRSGQKPPEEVLVAARDALRQAGIAVAAGVATIRGTDFGVASDQPGIWLNYSDPKTQTDLQAHIAWTASLFDEIIVDDFLATDDESKLSQQARGERSWSTFRLDLMTHISRHFIIDTAREVNPGVHLILKFPQWYDRFHRFGYNVEIAKTLYDRIWVGTETRNPATQRFGFVQATQGYINYSWLRSINQEQAGGGWFDYGDCTPEAYLMQAYQTILAGADEIVLFEAGSLVSNHPCMVPFWKRIDALPALCEIVHQKTATGLLAFKPPHSEASGPNGAANLYVFDYLATLGLSPIPAAQLPGEFEALFLARQAAEYPDIANVCLEWLKSDKTLVITPDFLATVNDPQLFAAAGYTEPFSSLPLQPIPIQSFRVGSASIEPTTTSTTVRPIPIPRNAEILIEALAEETAIPILSRMGGEDGGTLLVLNLATFTHEDFAPDKEQFLPPYPLSITDWPDEISNAIRAEIPSPWGLDIECPNQVGIYYYDRDTLIFTNFNGTPVQCHIASAPRASLELQPRFPHVPETRIEQREAGILVHIAPWEIAVLRPQP
ncbi:MAG: hypothetical protein RBU29_04655 [bacterium]|jgi:hypothetical protein|nr:hypothetical protein [bacterium]